MMAKSKLSAERRPVPQGKLRGPQRYSSPVRPAPRSALPPSGTSGRLRSVLDWREHAAPQYVGALAVALAAGPSLLPGSGVLLSGEDVVAPAALVVLALALAIAKMCRVERRNRVLLTLLTVALLAVIDGVVTGTAAATGDVRAWGLAWFLGGGFACVFSFFPFVMDRSDRRSDRKVRFGFYARTCLFGMAAVVVAGDGSLFAVIAATAVLAGWGVWRYRQLSAPVVGRSTPSHGRRALNGRAK